MVYKFRVILDNEDDVFRDIAILADDTLEDLHNAIFNSFGFDGMEIGSFYTCDDTWNQEDEISLFDSGDVLGEMKIMSDYKLLDILDKENTKIIYVYDFINMWTFLVELAAKCLKIRAKKVLKPIWTTKIITNLKTILMKMILICLATIAMRIMDLRRIGIKIVYKV
jgi:Plasmid pRiA4b ORF-3-like protein